jgi:hypothetical protein
MLYSISLIFIIGFVLSAVAIRNGQGTQIFTFAFLFPAVTVGFILTEFSDFVLNAGNLFEIYYKSGAVSIAFFMLATCSIGGLVGYYYAKGPTVVSVPLKHRFKLSRRVINHMHFASIALGAISFSAFLGLANLAGGLEQYIFDSGAYMIEWTGLPVYLIFVVRLCYVSIVVQLWLWSYTKQRKHLFWALFFSVIPLINILFIFRRAEVIKLGVFYGYFLTNYHGFRFSRMTALFGISLMYLAFKVFPFLRSEIGKESSAGQLFGDAFSSRETYDNSEIGSGLFRIYQSMETGVFEYGAILYNAVIKQFVPAGLIGQENKSAIYFPTIENAYTSFTTFRFYVSPMGFAQAYQQFWLLGGLLFLLVGLIMGRLERRAWSSPRNEIFLVLMIPAAISTVSADLAYFGPQFIIFSVMVLVCVPGGSRR